MGQALDTQGLLLLMFLLPLGDLSLILAKQGVSVPSRFGISNQSLTPTPPELTHPPSEPCQPVQALPGSIVGSLLWPRQRAGHDAHHFVVVGGVTVLSVSGRGK